MTQDEIILLIEKLIELTEKNKLKWMEIDPTPFSEPYGYVTFYGPIHIKVQFPWLSLYTTVRIDDIRIRNIPKKQKRKLVKIIILQVSRLQKTQRENRKKEHQEHIKAILKEQ